MARPCPATPTYQRRQPEQTVLYRTIAAHLPAFLARTTRDDRTGGWPAFVRREFERYLKCGILAHGPLRVQCERCGDTTVVAFNCRGRGFCPSCGGRRMSELAAHLVDHVLPPVPIRQWVFTAPVPVRYQLAFDAGLTRAVLRVFLRTVFGWQRRCAARRGLVGARGGSVTAIRRFGGSLNINVHFHALLFDGVYMRASPTTRPVFHRLPPPTDGDIAELLTRVHRRARRLLLRRGRGPDEDAGTDPFAAQEPLFAQTVAASLHGRVALGPRAGQPARRLRSAVAVTATGRRSARLEGFSLHADVAVPARRRNQLEKLCRYLVRPPLALERLTESSGGQLLYYFRRAWSDGSTALLVEPLELLEPLAALVPPPRRPLLAYHGLLAIDLSTTQGRLTLYVFAMLAEIERDMIGQRVKAGLAATRARGDGAGPAAQGCGPRRHRWTPHRRLLTG
jgi:Putative transposase/Transposase zinc-binding domain/Resolvase, N terminal domain